jgi:hypothetical protein
MVARSVSFFKGVSPPLMDSKEARQVLVALLAALESARLAMPVDLADFD